MTVPELLSELAQLPLDLTVPELLSELAQLPLDSQESTETTNNIKN